MKYQKLKQNITIEDFMHFIPHDEIERVLGVRRYKKFLKFMNGQTQSMHGVYPGDLDRFLRNLPVID